MYVLISLWCYKFVNLIYLSRFQRECYYIWHYTRGV